MDFLCQYCRFRFVILVTAALLSSSWGDASGSAKNKNQNLPVILTGFTLNDQDNGRGLTDESNLLNHFTYKTLSPYRKQLFDDFLNRAFPDRDLESGFLERQPGTRTAMRVAWALLYRNNPGDREKAADILKWIFALQNTDKTSRDFGVWRGSPKEAIYADQNMREFIGTDLIVVYHKYRNLLPAGLVKELENALVITAMGDRKRNVDPDYNNISIMSSFLLEYVGTAFNLPGLKKAGIRKAKAIYSNYHKYNALCEYNSPTYYGVDFVGLALWRELAFAEDLRKMGKDLEIKLWNDVAEFYNANLQNICGPFLRSYGMDMKKYTAITGVWIAAAVDDPAVASIPAGSGSHDESDFIVPVLDLGISMPVKALDQFRHFGTPRFINHITPNYYEGDRLKKVTACIEEDWMMGGLWGNRKVSRILMTGTMHWNTPDGDIGWLCVPGEGKTNVRVTKSQMEIYRADPKATTFELLVYAKTNDPGKFDGEKWNLSPMTLHFKTELAEKNSIVLSKEEVRKVLETPVYYPGLIKIVFKIPADWKTSDPLLIIQPEYIQF